MKPVFVAASFVATLAFCVPEAIQAQEPRRKPPTTSSAAPAEQSAPRERAVPREAAAPREAPPKSAPRTETIRGEATRVESSTSERSENNDDDDGQRPGAVRRPPSDGGGSGGVAPRNRAVARTSPPPRDWDDDDRYDRVYYYPSYWSYGRYYDPYYYSGFHLGYLAYAPWGWTPAFYGYPYAYGGYAPRGYDMGAVRIKVKQRDAEVYVDGYFAGNVDDFDGAFQSLKLETGGYKIEIRKPGFETLYFDVHVQPDRTITYRGDMKVTP